VTPEVTPESTADWLPDLPIYTLSDDCETIEPLLTVASNGTLWLALLKDDADDWLALDTLEDDPHPPQLDARGRYFGCAIPDEGAQPCYVLVTLDEVDYLVRVPLWVGDAYFAPQVTATEEPETHETPEPQTGDNLPPQSNGGNSPQPTPTDDLPPDEDDT
jgi:hypothetical protein